MADLSVDGLGELTSPASNDEIGIWDVSAGQYLKITRANLLGATITGAGTIATGGYTLTVPATGTAALLSVANTYAAAPQTITSTSNLALELIRTGATNVALKFTDSGGNIGINGGGNGLYVSSALNVPLELNRSSGSYAALKLSDGAGSITLNGGGGGFLVSTLSGTGTAAVEATNLGVVQRSASDARLKQDVTAITPEEALQLALLLRPVRYNWRDQAARGSQREIGLIAQEVAPHVPEVVSESPDGTLGINYPRLVSLLIGAVQELTARVAALEAQAQ